MIKIAGENVWPKQDGDINYASDFNRIDILSNSAIDFASKATTTFQNWEDTNITLDVTTNSTSTIIVILEAIASHPGGGGGSQGQIRLDIGGTVVFTSAQFQSGDPYDRTISIRRTGVSAGTITTKVQMINNDAGSVQTTVSAINSITVIAIPE